MNPPLVDLDTAPPAAVLAALREHGCASITTTSVPAAAAAQALADVRAFFAGSDAAKQALAIERSPHSRGYSRLHNERDFREQLHFGREQAAVTGAPYHRLLGPNPWPADAAWSERMRGWFAASERVAVRLLAQLAAALGARLSDWLGGEPYVLHKCIGYHAQPPHGERRRGVAAHLDFSLLTLTLQDDVGGLATRAPDGVFRPAPPRPGAWLAVVGELLQFATGNRLVATPHRVENPSTDRMRCSIPTFVLPSLDATLRPMLPRLPVPERAGDHVHAVLDPTAPPPSLHVGAAEWRRKGENRWCAVCAPGPAGGREIRGDAATPAP